MTHSHIHDCLLRLESFERKMQVYWVNMYFIINLYLYRKLDKMLSKHEQISTFVVRNEETIGIHFGDRGRLYAVCLFCSTQDQVYGSNTCKTHKCP